ncbi:MAG: hypothetical protein HKN17_05515, partial [Rhodothermales bacterium]|nr:hypothetical protein [Rhodothermales bacterium]
MPSRNVLSRLFSLLSKRLLQTVLLAVVLLVVLFFALTRTQVGRDELARQAERAFSERYEGTLTIRRLTGNLLNTLYADDVALLSAAGDTVIFVDSVVVEPHWSALLQRSFSVRSLELYRPLVRLEPAVDPSDRVPNDTTDAAEAADTTDALARSRRAPAGSETSLARALTRRTDPGADSSDESLWRFLGARLRIEDGRLTSDLNPGQLARIA